MTTTTTDHREASDESAPRRLGRRGWVIVAVGAVVAVLLAVWLVVGLQPDVSASGSGGVLDTASAPAKDDDTGTSWWVDKSDGGFWVAVRNDGRTAVSLSGVAPTGNLEVDVQFAPGTSAAGSGKAVDSYTLQPGAEVQVRAALHVCGPVVSGSSVTVDHVDLRATTWGLTRTVHVAAGRTYGFYPSSLSALAASKSC